MILMMNDAIAQRFWHHSRITRRGVGDSLMRMASEERQSDVMALLHALPLCSYGHKGSAKSARVVELGDR